MPFPNLHHDNSTDVANAQTLEIPIQGPGDANRLLIFTGTAIIDQRATLPNQIFDAELWIPLPNGYGPPASGFTATSFLAIAAEMTADLDGNFQITNVQANFEAQQNSIMTSFTIIVDEVDIFHRLAYQVSAPLRSDVGARFSGPGACDAQDFQAYPSVAHDGDSSVQNPSFIQCILPSTARNAANMFVIYTGDAWTGIYPTDDMTMRRSTATVFLDDIDLLQSTNLLNASASTTPSHITNNSRSNKAQVMCAVNCVDIGVQASGAPQKMVPAVRTLVSVLGEAANSGVSRIAYQANVEIALPLRLLVSATGQPGSFASSAQISGPGYWFFEVILPFPAPPPAGGLVGFLSSNPAIVPNPQHVTVGVGQQSVISSTQTAHNVQNDVDVILTATFGVLGFGIIRANAALRVVPPPH